MKIMVAGAVLLCLTGCVSDRTTVVTLNSLTSNTAPQPSNAGLHPGPLVGHELRKLRLAEEAEIISRTGHPQPLPTGACSILVPLLPGGAVNGVPVVQCDNPALVSDMTKAVVAAAPFPVPASVTELHLFIRAVDMEPGVGENQ